MTSCIWAKALMPAFSGKFYFSKDPYAPKLLHTIEYDRFRDRPYSNHIVICTYGLNTIKDQEATEN